LKKLTREKAFHSLRDKIRDIRAMQTLIGRYSMLVTYSA